MPISRSFRSHIKALCLISRGLLPQAQLAVCLFVCLGEDLCPLGNLFPSSSEFAGDRQPGSPLALAGCTRMYRLFLLPGLLQSRGKRRRETHMLARYQEGDSLSWLTGTVAAGTSDGSIRRSAIGPIAEERPREFKACMQHSLTWREHARAGSIGIQSAYRQGLRSCRDITICHMGGALPMNKVRPLLVYASCVSSLLERSSNRSSGPEAT